MFTRFYDQGDSAISDDSSTTTDDQKKISDFDQKDPDKGKQDDKDVDKSNTDTTDYKAKFEESEKGRKKADDDFKEFQRGITPKLEKLSEIEKKQQAMVDETDDLVVINKQIEEIDKEIPRYKEQNVDTTGLKATRLTLVNQQKQIANDRQRSAADAKLLQFQGAHKEFTDYAGLTRIIVEANANNEDMGWNGAFKIWSKDQEIAKMKESANIDKENTDLGKTAKGQDGGPAPTDDAKEGRKADTDFYTGIFGKDKAAKMLGKK